MPTRTTTTPTTTKKTRLNSCSGRIAQMLGFVLATAFASAASAEPASQNLGGTSWQLVRIKSMDDQVVTPDDRTKYTIAFGTDGRVSIRVDCNRGSGTWKSAEASQLVLELSAMTRAMCPPGSLHDRIVKDMPFVRSYLIGGGHLYLSLVADVGVYELEPISSAGAPAAVAPGAQAGTAGPSFDCAKASAAVENVICNDSLATLDRQLAGVCAAAAAKKAGTPAPPWLKTDEVNVLTVVSKDK